MYRNFITVLTTLALIAVMHVPVNAAGSFAELVGSGSVGSVKQSGAVQVPFITWGGDTATFHANGGLKTASGTTFNKLGLNLQLTAGDDFVQQVRDYRSGKSPFLRGTMRMIGMASEVIGSDPRTKPVVFMQMTWSAGDHMVSRAQIKTISDLKGKTVALQQGGPHVGMLDDILKTAKLSWNDINVKWMADLTGDKGPATLFKKDSTIDACMVISPDMLGLTGGLDTKGTGAEGTVKGAKVLVSTAQLSRSIADVYAVRKDYFDANRATVEKFAAGYLKASEEVDALKTTFEKTGKSATYMKLLKMTQDIYGKEVIPTLEVDAHGLILDCTFVRLTGNVAWYTQKGNLVGFEAKQKAALDLAAELDYAKVRAGFFPPNFDYAALAKLGNIKSSIDVVNKGRFGEVVDDFDYDNLDENTIAEFTINFEPNQTSFSADVYGPEFLRAIEASAKFGNAIIAIRGHSDPTKTLVELIRAGMEKKILKRSGTRGNYKYFLKGRPLDLEQTRIVTKLIESGELDGAKSNPRQTMQAALNLSRARAQGVRNAILAYAKAQGFTVDETQIQPAGVGVGEPLIPKPTNLGQARQNMRVEFRVLKIPAEAVKASDFDF